MGMEGLDEPTQRSGRRREPGWPSQSSRCSLQVELADLLPVSSDLKAALAWTPPRLGNLVGGVTGV